MEYFEINQTAGTGNAVIRVSTKKNNTSGSNKGLTLTVTNGAKTKVVYAEQYFRPVITLVSGSTTIPATGGSLTYQVNSEYDFVFDNVPSFVTIRDAWNTGVTYASGERIITNQQQQFLFEIAPNYTTTGRTSGSLCMGHYINNVKQSYTEPITFAQVAGEEKYIINPGTMYLDYPTGSFDEFGIDTNLMDLIEVAVSDNEAFQVIPTSGYDGDDIGVYARDINNTHNTKSATVTIFGGGLSQQFTVYQKHQPYVTLVSGETSGISCNGAVIQYLFDSEYDFLFENIPAWITVSDGTNTFTNNQRYTKPSGPITLYFTVASNSNLTDRQVLNLKLNTYYDGGSALPNPIFFAFYQNRFEPVIEPWPTTVWIDYLSAATGTFDVDANVQGYTITNYDPTLFALNASTGTTGITTFTVSAITKNTGHTKIEGLLSIADNLGQAITRTVFVNQRFEPYVTGDTYTSDGMGETLVFSAFTEYPIAFSGIPAWFSAVTNEDETYQYSEGEIIQPTGGTVIFKVITKPNYSITSRTSTDFCMRYYVNNVLQSDSESIAITQPQGEFVYVMPSAVTADATGETKYVYLDATYGMNWVLGTKSPWIAIDPTSGGWRTTTVDITVDANIDSARTGYVQFLLSGSNTANAVLLVSQDGVDFIDVTPTYTNLTSPVATYVQFTVSASTPWSILADPGNDWLHFEPTTGTGNVGGFEYVDCEIDENDTGSPRIAMVEFQDQSGQIICVVDIYQEG